jgi:8-oxo-dGTP pyrophosphatase MutT (NUDIX family)
LNFFEVVPAAGGLVVNSIGELLFIRRNERWDLPKGRMELGETSRETALREVIEECGISQLEIVEDLPVSYHIYQENTIDKLKKTYWFMMNTKATDKPIPQTEEGITKAEFVELEKLENYFPEMYSNIRDIVNNYLNKIKE